MAKTISNFHLDYLNPSLNSLLFFSEQRKSLLELIKVSEEWNIDSVYVRRDVEMDDKGFSDLAKCSTRGHLGTLALSSSFFGGPRLMKEDVKAIFTLVFASTQDGFVKGENEKYKS